MNGIFYCRQQSPFVLRASRGFYINFSTTLLEKYTVHFILLTFQRANTSIGFIPFSFRNYTIINHVRIYCSESVSYDSISFLRHVQLAPSAFRTPCEMRCVIIRIRSDMTFRSDMECPHTVYTRISNTKDVFFFRIERIQTTLPRARGGISADAGPIESLHVTRNILDGRRGNTANSKRTRRHSVRSDGKRKKKRKKNPVKIKYVSKWNTTTLRFENGSVDHVISDLRTVLRT